MPIYVGAYNHHAEQCGGPAVTISKPTHPHIHGAGNMYRVTGAVSHIHKI